ncbi:unnamed protein product [Owenia fusiformis]|uniref:Uncharacterized protein n=1 Tax=Owenia fusiformis TaxID=6347 RepID=A0A8J1UUA8_OWEFU|nr:unnamed protein product [Owenia fusiformis]
MESKREDFKSSFCQPWEGGDIILISDTDERVYASKSVLEIASPVFKTMFNSDFLEKTKTEIPLPGKTTEDLVCFMEAIHPLTWIDITEANIDVLLRLSDEYQVDKLMKKCKKYLSAEKPSLENFIRANEYEFEDVKKDNLDFLISEPMFTTLEAHPWFPRLQQNHLMEIMRKKLAMLEFTICATSKPFDDGAILLKRKTRELDQVPSLKCSSYFSTNQYECSNRLSTTNKLGLCDHGKEDLNKKMKMIHVKCNKEFGATSIHHYNKV